MTLFVSKKVTHETLLNLIEKHSINLIDRSMISFNKADFDCPKNNQYDIVFFSSPRSVHYFMKQCSLPPETDIGCIGSSTEAMLKEFNILPKFVGRKSGNPADVAREFKAFTNGRKVLFPQSDRSHRSMQQQLKNDQINDLIVYRTVLSPISLSQHPDILVFTSPSNCEAFLKSNVVSENQTIIAWGTTTERFLKEKTILVDHVLETSTFSELTHLLENLY